MSDDGVIIDSFALAGYPSSSAKYKKTRYKRGLLYLAEEEGLLRCLRYATAQTLLSGSHPSPILLRSTILIEY